MFVSFCLIVKYPWVLIQLSLNFGIVPGSGHTNDDVTSLLQICHNNNSNKQQLQQLCKSIFSRIKQMTSIYFYTNISHPQMPHISNVHL